MRRLTIGFSRNRQGKIFSRILQWYLKTDISHCYIKYETDELIGDNAIYQSIFGKGIGYMSEQVFLKDNIQVREYQIELSEEMYCKVRKDLFLQCGKDYGFMQNIGIFIVDSVRRILKLNIKNPFKGGQNCSELILRHLLKEAYPKETEGLEPNTVSPKQIEEVVKSISI